MYDYRRGGGVLGAFLLGGLVGAVLGLLFSPRSGKENREMLAEAADKYWNEGKELYETGSAKVSEVYSSGRETLGETSEQVKAKIDDQGTPCGAKVKRQKVVQKKTGETSVQYVCEHGHKRPDAHFHPIKKGTVSHTLWVLSLCFSLIVLFT